MTSRHIPINVGGAYGPHVFARVFFAHHILFTWFCDGTFGLELGALVGFLTDLTWNQDTFS